MNRISEWMDGELDGNGTRQQVERLKQDTELRQVWDTYHLIGDIMRGERALSPGFERRLSDRLAAEPTVLAPRSYPVRRFATYALSTAASLSAVALVGWLAYVNNLLGPRTEVAIAPNTPQPAVIAPEPQLASVQSDGTMNEYLIAHQEFSPSTEIQGLAPYIRGVSSLQPVTAR